MFLLLCKPFGLAQFIFCSMILKEIICHDNLLLELAVDATHLDDIRIVLASNEFRTCDTHIVNHAGNLCRTVVVNLY
jgi:hypothetical protein